MRCVAPKESTRIRRQHLHVGVNANERNAPGAGHLKRGAIACFGRYV